MCVYTNIALLGRKREGNIDITNKYIDEICDEIEFILKFNEKVLVVTWKDLKGQSCYEIEYDKVIKKRRV